jgi:hypothetical protein
VPQWILGLESVNPFRMKMGWPQQGREPGPAWERQSPPARVAAV